MVDLHRHDEFSLFDGFGNAESLANLAVELGHTALSTSNHGNTHGLIKTYKACKNNGIKAILGVETYFLPTYIEQHRGYHLCLFAKNIQGYKNLNRILYLAEDTKYYNPIVLFSYLKKYHEGIICSTACIGSYFSQMIKENAVDKAEKALITFKKLFKDDFYIEIMPYKVDGNNTQEKVNLILITLANKLNIKCILTSDSHYGRKEDFDTYIKMHEIGKHGTMDILETYGERYMPTEQQVIDRFLEMHGNRSLYGVENAKKIVIEMIENLEELENSVENDILDVLPMELPIVHDIEDTKRAIKKKVIAGLKEKGKYTPEHKERCKKELDVIQHHGFEDYFLIVADYVKYAKDNGVTVGPGRGSVCNSEVAYALGITEVDSIKFGLDFRRFLRKDKKKYPDIDLDFETKKRGIIIDYLIDKYKGQSAQICNYGMYKVDNLVNDLAKVCGLNTIGEDIELEEKQENKIIIKDMKKYISSYVTDDVLDTNKLESNLKSKAYNKEYDNIIKHFLKLYGKVRYIGTHAAGVAITGGELLDYCAIKKDVNGRPFTYYDLNDIQEINVTKFDILGLQTMEGLGELRQLTGNTEIKEELLEDKKLLKAFKDGNTDGIFQLEKDTAKKILANIYCDCFEDIVATNSMNRPGPLMLGMPEQYAQNKESIEVVSKTLLYPYTKETYGTIVYQEQIQHICVFFAGMSWGEADGVMKLVKDSGSVDPVLRLELETSFINGAVEKGITKDEAQNIFNSVLTYSFCKGHAVGYALIAFEEMFYKVNYPLLFWVEKLKSTSKEINQVNYKKMIVKSGDGVIWPPHVNGSVNYIVSAFDGEQVIQEGLLSINGIGIRAAESIIKYSPYIDKADFLDKVKEMEDKRAITKKVIGLLEENNCLEFDDKKRLNQVTSYNLKLASSALSRKV